MIKHIELNKKTELSKEHFEKWIELWEETVKENFEGKKAEEAVQRARNMHLLCKVN